MNPLKYLLVAAAAATLTSFAGVASAWAQAVKVGMLPNNPPYSNCDRATNTNHQGAAFEIFSAIAADAGFTIEPQCDFVVTSLAMAMTDGTIDVRLNSTCVEPEHLCSERFTTTFTGLTIPAADMTAYATFADLMGKTVGAVEATSQAMEVAAAGIMPRLYPDFAALMGALTAGEIQAAISNGGAAAYRINVLGQYPGVRFVDTFQGDTRENGFQVRAAHADLLMRINASLAKLKADGTIAQILMEWSLPAI